MEYSIHTIIDYIYLIASFLSPPNAITVLIADRTSSAIAPALANADCSLIATTAVI